MLPLSYIDNRVRRKMYNLGMANLDIPEQKLNETSCTAEEFSRLPVTLGFKSMAVGTCMPIGRVFVLIHQNIHYMPLMLHVFLYLIFATSELI